MYFSLEILPARKGDCLLLHYGDGERKLMMIDGGPAQVYAPHLKPRLAELGADPADPLIVDVLLVSHIDDDHIRGILDMTKELREAKMKKQALPVRVVSLWHNSFEAILGAEKSDLMPAARTGAASLAGQLPDEDEIPDPHVAMVLASVPQGFKLREDASFLEWSINEEFPADLIAATTEPVTVTLGGAVTMTVIGPMKPELDELRKIHAEWVRKRAQGEQQQTVPAAYLDKSVPNLSSVVLLAEAGGKRALLTGDARGDKILAGLELAKVIPPGGFLHLDLLKIQHHGSAHNMADDFFRRVTADHYVFSGDGEHGNPERETIETLLTARGGEAFTLHFTYPIATIDEERKLDWAKERNKQLARQKKNPAATVKPEWDAQRHSLASLFAAKGLPTATQRLSQVDPKRSYVIDLLDPLD